MSPARAFRVFWRAFGESPVSVTVAHAFRPPAPGSDLHCVRCEVGWRGDATCWVCGVDGVAGVLPARLWRTDAAVVL
jgi:hypothetical protein